LRYAERLKFTTDDEETVEKYMASKPIVNKSQEFNYQFSKNEEEEEIYDDRVNTTYKDPRLYMSQDFSAHFHDSNIINYDEQQEEMEEEEETHPRNMFDDSHNFIEINPSAPKDYQPKHYEEEEEEEDYKEYETEPVKNYELEVSKNVESAGAGRYVIMPKSLYTNSRTSSYKNLHSDYDSQSKYKRSYEREYQSQRKTYVENDNEYEDDLMEVESDKSDGHNSPQMYISKNHQTSFSKNLKLRENAQSAKIELQHSSSNNKLRYRKDIRPARMDYSKDQTRSSTSNIGASYLQRTGPPPCVELELHSEDNEPTNKTSADLSNRLKTNIV
jgi:hypothetical protein